MSDSMCYGFDVTVQTDSHDHAAFCHHQIRSHKPKVNFLITQDKVNNIRGSFDALVDLENLNRIPIRRWTSTLNGYSKKLKKGGLLFLQALVSSHPQNYLDIPKKNQMRHPRNNRSRNPKNNRSRDHKKDQSRDPSNGQTRNPQKRPKERSKKRSRKGPQNLSTATPNNLSTANANPKNLGQKIQE